MVSINRGRFQLQEWTLFWPSTCNGNRTHHFGMASENRTALRLTETSAMDKQKSITPEELGAHCEFAGSQAQWLGAGLGGAIYLLFGGGIINKEAWIFTPIFLLTIISAPSIFFTRVYHGKIAQVIRCSPNKDSADLKEWLPNVRTGDISLDVGFSCLAIIVVLLLLEILKPEWPSEIHENLMKLGCNSNVDSIAIAINIFFILILVLLIFMGWRNTPQYHLKRGHTPFKRRGCRRVVRPHAYSASIRRSDAVR